MPVMTKLLRDSMIFSRKKQCCIFFYLRILWLSDDDFWRNCWTS